MPSSTSRRGSLNLRLLAVLMIGLVGAPIVWLTTLQTGYVLAYQACDDRSNSWVMLPTIAAVVIAGVMAAVSVFGQRRAGSERMPLPFIGRLAIGMAGLMVIVLAASTIAPALLHPCD